MAWIESHQSLGAHPKTKKLARLLSVPLPQVVGHLHMLWWWAFDYAQDGDLSRYAPEDIADAVLWEGSASLLMESLLDAGFLDQPDGKPRIHDWDEYGGKLLAKRRSDAERKKGVGKPVEFRATSNGTPTELLRESQVEDIEDIEERRGDRAREGAPTAAAAENSTYLGVRIPPGLRDRVIEHCEALGTRNLDAETVQAVIQCHEDLPAQDIDWARKELRRSVPRRAAWPGNVREVIAQRDGVPQRPVSNRTEPYREPPPPHIDDVLEAIKNRPHREPSDPGEDALLADMKARNPAAYEAEMNLRRRAHERAMST